MKPFQKQELIRPSGFNKLFKIEKKENFIIEVNNYLAEREFNDLLKTDIELLMQKYKIKNVMESFPKEIESLITRFSVLHLCNPVSSSKKGEDVRTICQVLCLSETSAETIIHEQLSNAFLREVSTILQTERNSSPDVMDRIEVIQSQLGLSDEITQPLFDEARKKNCC